MIGRLLRLSRCGLADSDTDRDITISPVQYCSKNVFFRSAIP
jgi:hypothetical protein